MADTMGSTETDSTPELHKLYIEDNLYVACAGNIEMASEVISLFKQQIASQPDPKTTGGIWDALNSAVHEHRITHFRWDVIAPKYSFTNGAIFEGDHPNIVRDWQEYDTGLQLLVGTFHPSGMALLYYVGRCADTFQQVFPIQFPGHWSIGTGSYNANSWLNFRKQQLGLHPVQSAYHTYEAKLMANSAPTVNANLEAVVAFADRHYLLTQEKQEEEGCPVSLSEMKSLYKRLGPQNTNELGYKIPKPQLVSRKSRPKT
jgi:hypothetical protein